MKLTEGKCQAPDKRKNCYPAACSPIASFTSAARNRFLWPLRLSKRAYLDACINSRGGSTFTEEQFRANRIQYDVQFNRLLPWLLGQQELRDQRCLWTHLSIPLNQSSPESSYHILENAWFSWYSGGFLTFHNFNQAKTALSH
jgi:cyanosortase A-associated protein